MGINLGTKTSGGGGGTPPSRAAIVVAEEMCTSWPRPFTVIGGTLFGKVAVAAVVLNRVADPRFPIP